METTLHPTPQFARKRWLDLCGAWEFAFDDQNVGLDQGWDCRPDVFDRQITVPYPPEAPANNLDGNRAHPVMWYRKMIPLQKPAGADRVLLHFGAADYLATVWVNGQMMGSHRGGNTPFSFDITRAMIPGAPEQAVVVRVEDQPLDLAQPRGKQDWQDQPHAIWYQRTSGLWQPVWIEWAGADRIESIRWTPDVPGSRLELSVALNRAPAKPLTLKVALRLRDEIIVEDTYTIRTRELCRDLRLPFDQMVMDRHKYLWSPQHPNLLEAEITLLDGEARLDEIQSYAGLRSAGLENGRFLLNGQPMYLRMVLEQGYWHETCLAAPSEDALKREVQLMKDLGFNGVRIHQKVEDPRFLYYCDRLGLMVWGEMANAYLFNAEAGERLVQEWMEVLKRDYNHPCIVTWVPLNESWGTPGLPYDSRQRDFLRTLYSLTRSFDPTRPVIDNDGWEHVQTDILSLHDYAKAGQTLLARYGSMDALRNTLDRGRPIGARFVLDGYQMPADAVVMLTEFGGISYKPEEGTPWFGYGTVSSAEEYLAALEDLVHAVLACPTISGFCYTQLTDTEQETNGLLTADRQPKFDIKLIRQIITAPKTW